MSAHKSALERVLDITVYAPLGFVLSGDTVVADLAATGRKQIAFNRSLGRAALKGLARGAQSSAAAKSVRAVVPGASIDGYADMTAKQVISLLAQCSGAQAEWIQAAEAVGKNRITVLRAIKARD